MAKSRYLRATFMHWKNLSFLGGGTFLAALTHSPGLALFTVAVEAAVLWVLPDIPRFQQLVDESNVIEQLEEEREFYVRELFGVALRDRGTLFSEGRRASLSTLQTYQTGGREFEVLSELVVIVNKLGQLAAVQHAAISETQLEGANKAINGWLRLQYAAKALQEAISRADATALWERVDTLKSEIAAAPAIRVAVIRERLRLVLLQLRALPKLQARYELCLAKSEGIVYALRQMGDAAAANQGADVSLLAESLVDHYALLEQDLAELAIQSEVRHELGDIDWGMELGGPSAEVKVLSPPEPDDLSRLEDELRAAMPAYARR